MEIIGHYLPSDARSQASRLAAALNTFVLHDSDRAAVAISIPALADALLDFEQTLRVLQPQLNDCDGCGEPGTLRVCDEEDEEFFICDSFECAEWADPAQQFDTTDACWVDFKHPRLQPPSAKAPRLATAAREDDADPFYDEDEELDEDEECDEEEWQDDDDADAWEGDEV